MEKKKKIYKQQRKKSNEIKFSNKWFSLPSCVSSGETHPLASCLKWFLKEKLQKQTHLFSHPQSHAYSTQELSVYIAMLTFPNQNLTNFLFFEKNVRFKFFFF